MRTIIPIIAAALVLPLAAQSPARPVPVRAAQPQNTGSAQEDGGLSQNVRILLRGATTTEDGIDLEVTGAGPRFSAQQMVGKDESVMSCEYLLTETEGGYRVSYTIGIRVKFPVSGNNYEYRDVTTIGKTLCQAGKPVGIMRNGGKLLELVVTRAEEAPEVKPITPPAPTEGR